MKLEKVNGRLGLGSRTTVFHTVGNGAKIKHLILGTILPFSLTSVTSLHFKFSRLRIHPIETTVVLRK